MVLGTFHLMWNFTHQTPPSYLKISPGIWKLSVKSRHLGRVSCVSLKFFREEHAYIIIILTEMPNKSQLNESKHPMRFAKWCLFAVESLVLSRYFPLPDPGGKACGIEILSSTHHNQIGWHSVLNNVAILSASALKFREENVFGCLCLLCNQSDT